MQGVAQHLAGILREWGRALGSWRGNPLCRYWFLAQRRRSEVAPWWLRSPGLALSGLLIALAVTVGEVLVILDFQRFTVATPAISYLHIARQSTLAVAVLLAGALVFTFIWLLARVHAVVMFALGFLETDPRQVLRTVLDDLVATSHLTAQEILTGAVTHALRLTAPPLVALSLLSILAAWPRLQWELPAILAGDTSALGELGGVVVRAALVFITGSLAVAALCCLLIAVSLNRQSALAPPIGAVSIVVMQLVLISGAGYLRKEVGNLSIGIMEIAPGCLALFIMSLILLLYLARRLLWLRRALAYGFPLLILFPAEVLLGVIVFSGYEAKTFGVIFQGFTWALQSLAVLAPLYIIENISGQLIKSSFALRAILFGGQLVLVVAMAEFARDAVRRRKWGAESEKL